MFQGEKQVGEVVAVCLSDTKAFPKYPQDSVEIFEYGVKGDAHWGELRPSYSQLGKMKKNDRAVSVVADEARQYLNQELGLDIQPDGFNENILVRGMGDLSNQKGGERLVFSSGVILKVTEQNPPCKTFKNFAGADRLVKTLVGRDESGKWNKRSLVATVVSTGVLRPRDTLFIEEADIQAESWSMLKDILQHLEQCASYPYGVHVLANLNGRKGVLLKFDRDLDFEWWQIGQGQEEADFVRSARHVFAGINAVRANPKIHWPQLISFYEDRLVALTLPNGQH